MILFRLNTWWKTEQYGQCWQSCLFLLILISSHPNWHSFKSESALILFAQCDFYKWCIGGGVKWNQAVKHESPPLPHPHNLHKYYSSCKPHYKSHTEGNYCSTISSQQRGRREGKKAGTEKKRDDSPAALVMFYIGGGLRDCHLYERHTNTWSRAWLHM